MIELHTKTIPIIKFQSEQIINEIQSGHIYMKELGYFRGVEQNEGDLDVGDKAEAIPFSTAYETPFGVQCTLRVMDGTKSNYVMCLMEPAFKNGRCIFTDVQKQKFEAWGESALVITDVNELYNRIANVVNEDMYLYSGNVFYYNENEPETIERMEMETEGLYTLVFMKRMKYAYQQEYRFVVQSEKIRQDNITFEIGDISDISVKLASKQLLENGLI